MSHHILLIEDTEDLGEMVRDLLLINGYQVSWAKDGKSGLDLFFKINPDLVLTDLVMPQMSGLELTKAIRQASDRLVPIIILSARASIEDQAIGLAAGANCYLKKPCSATLLIDSVKSLIK
jgi:DNA-binding response OmpR family regulator